MNKILFNFPQTLFKTPKVALVRIYSDNVLVNLIIYLTSMILNFNFAESFYIMMEYIIYRFYKLCQKIFIIIDIDEQ